MDNTILKIAIAAFFHDIGKFADKDVLDITEQYINDNSAYLPFRNGRHTHHHAVYTSAFIEYMKNDLPLEFNSGGWGDGDSFINLAAGHHNPETPLQQLITEADWLTSGMDRTKFADQDNRQISFRDYRKTRLLPLFEQLKNPGKDAPDNFLFAYPLKPLSPEYIFPEKKSKVSNDNSKIHYQELFDGFISELKRLRHKNENLSLWFEHFESLTMSYTSSIPSARAGDVLPDVSLYDHLRLTSAFASALYLYHRGNDSLNIDAVKKRNKQKFLLVSGNFYGIQNFIFSGYGDTRKYRSKLLRGRSFYVSLLSEISAHMLCDKIGLPFISVILNAAGKFTILAPNTEETAAAVAETKEKINEWLMDISYGEISIGFTKLKAAPDDFSPEKFINLWEKLGRLSEENKFSKIDLEKYGGVVSKYLDQFNNKIEHPLCPLCGKRPAVLETKNHFASDQAGPICRLCADHIFLGTGLVKNSRIIIGKKDANIWGRSNSLMEPVCGQYQLCFTSSKDKDYKITDMQNIIKYWNISNIFDSSADSDVTEKFLNGYVPVYDDNDLNDERLLATKKSDVKKEQMIEEIQIGEPKTLSHIAANALNLVENGKFSGIDALGILKADVDHLGMLMGCGLPEKRFTISRLATLSRQLNFYFALYLPHLLATDERFKNIYTVFAGGDDLFLIGPWNRIYDLVIVLQKTFSDYVCNNSAIHFSAGISLKKAHTPIDGMAEFAEEALEKSKDGRNRITMFSQTAEWEEIEQLEMIRKKLKEWLDEELITKSMLYRLNESIRMAAQAKELLQRKNVYLKEMDCLKWRALFCYSATRNIGKKIKNKEKRKQKTDELIACITGWLEKYEEKLKIPLWNILYNLR